MPVFIGFNMISGEPYMFPFLKCDDIYPMNLYLCITSETTKIYKLHRCLIGINLSSINNMIIGNILQ